MSDIVNFDSTQFNLDWNTLPETVIYEIYKKLSLHNRLSASSTCKHWRGVLYYSTFWENTNFVITSDRRNKAKMKFYLSVLVKKVTNAYVYFDSLNQVCLTLTNKLLNSFESNLHLKRLLLHPTYCSLAINPHVCLTCNPLLNIFKTSKNLEEISFGCLEEILVYVNKFLKPLAELHANSIRVLGIASLKFDPDNYILPQPCLRYFHRFTNLQIISVDYDAVNDDFLNVMRGTRLERLVIHVHGVSLYHNGTSDESWQALTNHNPNFRVRMNLIHSYDVIDNFHTTILRPAMPLSHLKVFFCEKLNDEALRRLVTYSNTLESLWWMDSFDSPNVNALLHENEGMDMNPFIFVSWRCKKLSELVLFGYRYLAEDVYAICRLRGFHLKKLDLAASNIIFSDDTTLDLSSVQMEVSAWMGVDWRPLSDWQLHSVILERKNGASDEYILPIVLKDLTP